MELFSPTDRGDLDNHHERYRVEVLSPYVIAELFCKLKSKKDRKLLFFTSPAAEYIVDDQPFGYHASKAAVNQLIRYLSVKFGQLGVVTNGSHQAHISIRSVLEISGLKIMIIWKKLRILSQLRELV